MTKTDDDVRNASGEYVYTGPKWLADLKFRLGRWLEEERGW